MTTGPEAVRAALAQSRKYRWLCEDTIARVTR